MKNYWICEGIERAAYTTNLSHACAVGPFNNIRQILAQVTYQEAALGLFRHHEIMYNFT